MVQKGLSAGSGTGVSFLAGKGDDQELYPGLQEQSGAVVLKPIWLDCAVSLPAAKAGKGCHPRQ